MSALTCIMCNAPNAKFCVSCHSASYCSPACQRTDWPLHKTICKSFTSLPSRPTPNHKLALFFPVNSKDPQLIWLNCDRAKGNGWSADIPDTEPLRVENLDPDGSVVAEEYKLITRNHRRGFDYSHTVHFICRKGFIQDGSPRNDCVWHRTKGVMSDWRGPILVTHQPPADIYNRTYEDIKAGDLRAAVDYFATMPLQIPLESRITEAMDSEVQNEKIKRLRGLIPS